MTGKWEPDRWHSPAERGMHAWTASNVRALLKAHEEDEQVRDRLTRVLHATRVLGRYLRRRFTHRRRHR